MRTVIVGGGLSGLAVANALERAGADYLLLEARNRFGGRILSMHHAGAAFDMGPSWFWPGQPRIAALVEQLGLERFEQYASGDVIAEDAQGKVHRGQGFASMAGSLRLKGGLAGLTQALAENLPEKRRVLNAQVVGISQTDEGVAIGLEGGQSFSADRGVLAVPPRVAAKIAFAPKLADEAMHAMNGVATWMAGHAKALAIYDTPVWRDAGLSGDAVSHIGPMVELHDASPDAGGVYALFGFIGVPPSGRRDEALLREHLRAQLVRLFGAEPLKLLVKDWAFDRLTATDADMVPLYAHPTYGLPAALQDLWDGRLQFAGTEVAPEFGGYIEGALEAAELVVRKLEGQAHHAD